ncbi:MAG: sodium-dependent transporter [Pseudomonadota bacterium]
MTRTISSVHGQWSTRLIFILAATGSAVGLGNIWKFPYITGINGGGAFVLVYLLCIAVIGIPIMMAEIMLGRRGRQDPINTMRTLAKESGHSQYWAILGWMGVIAGFLILSYYSVIAGWALAYVPRVASGMFIDQEAAGIKSIFTDLISDPERLIAWHSLFMFMTMTVVARGVKNGLEQAVRYLMPLLMVLLLVLLFYSFQSGSFMQGVEFLFKPDFSKLTAEGVLSAMGHAFFTLSLGMGAIMVYGSYLPSHTSIASSAIWIAIMDTLVALVAGLVIFPIVFANSLEPAAGPGLIFETLPLAFGHMPYGSFFGSLFFILLVFAAWTSSISLIEPAVVWSMDKFELSRVCVSMYLGILVWTLGLLSLFSFNILADITFSLSILSDYGEFVILKSSTFFDVFDYLTSNIMLPLGGLCIAVYAGWLMKRHASEDEFDLNPVLYSIWYFLVRYIAPISVIIVFMNAIGIIKYIQKITGVA